MVLYGYIIILSYPYSLIILIITISINNNLSVIKIAAALSAKATQLLRRLADVDRVSNLEASQRGTLKRLIKERYIIHTHVYIYIYEMI